MASAVSQYLDTWWAVLSSAPYMYTFLLEASSPCAGGNGSIPHRRGLCQEDGGRLLVHRHPRCLSPLGAQNVAQMQFAQRTPHTESVKQWSLQGTVLRRMERDSHLEAPQTWSLFIRFFGHLLHSTFIGTHIHGTGFWPHHSSLIQTMILIAFLRKITKGLKTSKICCAVIFGRK